MELFKIVSCLSVLVLTLGYTIAANGSDAESSEVEASTNWDFDIFDLDNKTSNDAMGHLFHVLLQEYGLTEKFKIQVEPLSKFLYRLKDGYNLYNVSYHGEWHAADTLQTVHSIIYHTGIKNWMSDLEILSILFAAVIHDNEHMGTSNEFLVNSKSERALIYNDLSVNENHHLYASFSLLNQDGCNFLSGLSASEYRQLRSIVITMVLHTDMATHLELLNKITGGLRNIKEKDRRVLVLSLILHCADISNPGKPWKLHFKWISMLMEEMYAQGDMEKNLGLDVCFMCDRNVNIPEVQISFIDNYVIPTFMALRDLMTDTLGESVDISEPWNVYLKENRKMWKDIADQDG